MSFIVGLCERELHGILVASTFEKIGFGPFRDSQLAAGVARNTVYDTTMYVLTGLLAVGFICNLLVRPVAAKWFMTDEQLAEERRRAHDVAQAGMAGGTPAAAGVSSSGLVYAAWIGVGVPILWGVWLTLQKVTVLFR